MIAPSPQVPNSGPREPDGRHGKAKPELVQALLKGSITYVTDPAGDATLRSVKTQATNPTDLKAAEADLTDVCSGPVSVVQTSQGFAPDTIFSVEVSCQVRGLAMLGLDIPTTLKSSFSSPLDPFRRTA